MKSVADVATRLFLGVIILLILAYVAQQMMEEGIISRLGLTDSMKVNLKHSEVTGVCKAWVQTFGLEGTAPTDLYKVLKRNGLDWTSCAPENLKTFDERCKCLKACIRALQGDDACRADPNSFGADGIGWDKAAKTLTFEGKSVSDAGSKEAQLYCFAQRISRVWDEVEAAPNCMEPKESETIGGMLTLEPPTTLPSDKDCGINLLTKNCYQSLNQLKAKCEIVCRDAECANMQVRLGTRCQSERRHRAGFCGWGGSTMLALPGSNPGTGFYGCPGGAETVACNDADTTSFFFSPSNPDVLSIQSSGGDCAGETLKMGESCTAEFTLTPLLSKSTTDDVRTEYLRNHRIFQFQCFAGYDGLAEMKVGLPQAATLARYKPVAGGAPPWENSVPLIIKRNSVKLVNDFENCVANKGGRC